ncbi:MAG: ATP-binding protein [Gemmatimonadales bacterium]
MISRSTVTSLIRSWLRANPAVALVGPRQCGKSTVARSLAKETPATYLDLEDPADLASLDQPMTTLEPLRGLVVIDEVQRRPDLFPVLRVLLDRRPTRAKFLLLGCASPDLLRQGSESLAGRVAFVEMGGFTLDEVGPGEQNRLWLRGGFPRAYLARSVPDSVAWREDFIRTFLERDLAQLGVRVPAATMRRFWSMVAHYSGGIWNGSEIGRSLGEAHTTVRRHLDTLAGALVVRVLEPWFENLSKRQVKAPKVYVRDTGLLHSLLGIGDSRQLERHPKMGGSWEGFVLEQILSRLPQVRPYYWRTQSGVELDLLLNLEGRRVGIEIKRADAPAKTPAMAAALADLKLHRLLVVYPGQKRYRLDKRIEVLPLVDCIDEVTA